MTRVSCADHGARTQARERGVAAGPEGAVVGDGRRRDCAGADAGSRAAAAVANNRCAYRVILTFQSPLPSDRNTMICRNIQLQACRDRARRLVARCSLGFPICYHVGGAQQNGSTAGLTPGPGTGSTAASLLRCAAQHMMAAAADLQRPRQPFKGCTVDASAQLRLKVSRTATSQHTFGQHRGLSCHSRGASRQHHTWFFRVLLLACRKWYVYTYPCLLINHCMRACERGLVQLTSRNCFSSLRSMMRAGFGSWPASAAHKCRAQPEPTADTASKPPGHRHTTASGAPPRRPASAAHPASDPVGSACCRGNSIASRPRAPPRCSGGSCAEAACA